MRTFNLVDVTVLGQCVNMNICEKEVSLNDIDFREIRKANEGGNQSSIISNNYFINTAVIAGRMFGRWVQEYLISGLF